MAAMPDGLYTRAEMKHALFSALFLGGVASAIAGGPAPAEIRLQHALSGVQAAELEELSARFNASQAAWRVVASREIASPHILQADETRTAELLARKKTV